VAKISRSLKTKINILTMANLVQSLLNESAKTAHFDQFSVANKLAAKWQKSGLLKGLNEGDRSSVAVILENQAKQLVVESSQTNQGGANFTAGNGEQWAGVALPLVRKIFGQIASKEFVSVQPMNLPAGLVFYLDFQYGNTKAPFVANDSIYGTPTANFGNAAAGALYGSGKFGFSLNQFSASAVFSATSITTASMFDVNFDAALTGSVQSGSIKKVSLPTSSLSGFDPKAVRSFVAFSGSGFDASAAYLYPAFTELIGANINFYFTASTAQLNNGLLTGWNVYYNKATDFNSRGDFEDRTGLP
jgi:hypothetical protein